MKNCHSILFVCCLMFDSQWVRCYPVDTQVGLAQQWDQLDQLGMRMQHNLDQQIQVRTPSGVSEDALREFSVMFIHFDKDESGQLDHQEFKSCLRALGYDLQVEHDGHVDPEFRAILDMVDPNRIKIWLDSLRTQYGKLSKRPSGSGARISERDRWIIEKFSFLAGHIYRVPKRAGVDLLAKLLRKHPERNARQVEELQTDEENSEYRYTDADEESQASQEEVPLSLESNKAKRSKRSSEMSMIREKLDQRLQASELLQDKLIHQLSAPLTPREAERHQWGQWFSAALPHIHDSLWGEFQASSLQLVESFRQRSRALEQQEHQHKQATTFGGDLAYAQRLQTTDYNQMPRGYLPPWQTKYQSAPTRTTSVFVPHQSPRPPVAARASSVPPDATRQWDTSPPSFGSVEATPVSVNNAMPPCTSSAGDCSIIANNTVQSDTEMPSTFREALALRQTSPFSSDYGQ